MNVSVDFDNIRPVEDSRRKGFEELCSQVAHEFEEVPDNWKYTRIGDPDAGIECKWESPDGEVWGWQAKYVDNIDNSSLSQVDRSVRQALDNYPNLSRYFVCVPCDRPHSPRDGVKTALEKWNDRKDKWEEWAEEEGMDVEFVFWGQSELLEFLSQDKHKGRIYFWFDSEQLTDAKLQDEMDVSISNAKDRYSPELHVDTGNADIFEPLGRTPAFEENMEELLEELDEKAGKLFTEKRVEVLEEADEDTTLYLRESIDNLPNLLEDIERIPEEIPLSELRDACEKAEEAIRELEPQLRTLKEEADAEKDEVETLEKSTLYDFRQLRKAVTGLKNYIDSNDFQAAEDAALKVLGDAGVGKTHLLCNVAKNRTEKGYPTVLLLGENFRDRDIWTQIIERLGLDCTTEEFLGALDSFGESRGVRSLLMIDALNESSNPRMWNRQLPGILSKLENYPHISLCVSCRTGYEELIFPDSTEDQFVETRHYGFNNVEYEAVRKFFDEHGIEHQSIPVLRREFQIPLFLKLFCENLENRGQSRISHGPEGISEIFEGYIDAVHDWLYRRLDYDPSDNKVRKAVEALAREMAKKGEGTKRLPRSEAKEIVDDLLPGRTYSESLYRNILSEGVISEVVPFEEDAEEAVRFSYDKFADHKIAQQYLELYVEDDIEEALSETEELQEIFENPELYAGLIQALAIHLPEQKDAEIFDFVDSEDILNPFIKSLAWRNPETLTESDGEFSEEIADYLWEELELLDDLHEIWRVLLTLSTSSDHPLNAEYLDEVLRDKEVFRRDFNWSKFLHEEWREDTSEVYRLVNWGFSLENRPVESYELKRLMSITLSWFFCCPNRHVRDRSTKAIVNVVDSDLEIYSELIECFQDVSDPYILERVYAAAYGGVLRHKQDEAVTYVAETVYELEFEDNDPTPHQLSRDYARGIIEVANRSNDSFDVDMENVRPPYDSSFSIDVPSPDTLREQVESVLEDSDTDLNSRFWWGLVGSDFEGRGHSDFARYIVGTNHSPSDVHGYDFSGEKALRWITKRVFDLGWRPDLFGSFDDFVNRSYMGRMENRKPERFSKKYQWIAYHELVSWVTDNCDFTDSITERPYNGSWMQFDRDIDPSVLDHEACSDVSLDDVVEYDCRIDETDLEEWISDHEEFPDLVSLLDISVNGERWIPLHGIYKWRADEGEDSRLERDVFARIDTVTVATEKKDELVSWLKEGWVDSDELESTPLHLATFTQTFWAEYPWHPSIEHGWDKDGDSIQGAPVSTTDTTADLLWESEYDCSVDDNYGMYAPSPPLAKSLDLEWVGDSKEFVQKGTNPVRIAEVSTSGRLYDSVNSLSMLAACEEIVDELEGENLSLVWVLQGEKRVITDDAKGAQMGLSQIRAVYHLEDGEWVGKMDSGYYN
ncbi:MAG: NACHT domain-containing NTPase [Halobacteria archaeon]